MQTLSFDVTGCVAYSYARFSDPIQGQGHSLKRQEDYAPEFCKENGLTLNSTLSFRDTGKSAFHGAHIKEGGGLARFIGCIEAGLVQPGDVLIIENLDRVSRLPLEAAEDLLKRVLGSGVRIHTRSPWAIYDRDTLNDPMQRMQMIFEFTRSHRESRYKQERLSRRWIANRENIRTGDYHLAKLPGWLKPIKSDKKVLRYEPIPEYVATVRRIFKMCNDGYGLTVICRTLNTEKVPTFGRGESWGRSSVAKVLSNRAVLGEYQPHTSVKFEGRQFESTKRVPTGEPVPNHYPRIINDDVFELAALALKKRKQHQSGAGAERVVNLFSGLLRDARTGGSMHVVDKGFGHQIVATAGVGGAVEAYYVPYAIIEQAFVTYADEMPLSMVLPREAKKLDSQIASLRKEAESLQLQVEKIKQKTRTNTSDALLELLVERDVELKQKNQEIETLERQRGSSATVAATASKDLFKEIAKASGAQLIALRTKLRNELRYWIKVITILPIKLGQVKAALVDVELQNGRHLVFRTSAELVNYPPELDDVDILQYGKWPKALKGYQWDTEQPWDAKLKKLDEAGLPLDAIAREMGVATSVVSRRLIELGRRRRPRKSNDSSQLMTWHAPGCGWTKVKNGKRYFVGMGTLKKLYPRLVKSEDKDGSMKAANKWWLENGPQE